MCLGPMGRHAKFYSIVEISVTRQRKNSELSRNSDETNQDEANNRHNLIQHDSLVADGKIGCQVRRFCKVDGG